MDERNAYVPVEDHGEACISARWIGGDQNPGRGGLGKAHRAGDGGIDVHHNAEGWPPCRVGITRTQPEHIHARGDRRGDASALDRLEGRAEITIHREHGHTEA